MVLANHRHIAIQMRLNRPDAFKILLQELSVALELDGQLPARLSQLVAVMDELDSLLQADCDEQPDCDRRDMDEEIFPGMDSSVGSVDVKHGRYSFLPGSVA